MKIKSVVFVVLVSILLFLLLLLVLIAILSMYLEFFYDRVIMIDDFESLPTLLKFRVTYT